MIVVTGATGQLGRAIVLSLVERIPADQIVASTRDPVKAEDLAALGVQVRQADYTDPDSLRKAFDGAAQLLMISSNAAAYGGDPMAQHRTVINVTQELGVPRIVYTSHMGARAGSPFAPGVDHAATESLLAERGLPFTSLRHGFYAESAFHLVGRGFDAGELRMPEDGPVNWTARADLAEADAAVLAEEGQLGGITPPLTAPQAYTMADLAAIASELTGREIKRITLTDDQWLDATVSQGVPAPMAGMLLGFYRAARLGDFAAVDPTLSRLLGRPPMSMQDVLKVRLAI